MTEEILEENEVITTEASETAEIIEEETAENSPAEAVEVITPEYPKHTELADFSFDENGQLVCLLNIDFRDFDIDIESYLHGDDNYSEKEYEAIYFEVLKQCNESSEYSIDCFQGRYTVRKSSEVEKIRYAAMSEEEKAEHDKQKTRYDLEVELARCEKELKSLDYIGVKIATGRANKEDYTDQIERMNELAARVSEIKSIMKGGD